MADQLSLPRLTENRVRRWVRTRVSVTMLSFLTGFIVAFCGCAIAGAVLTSTNVFTHFTRFFSPIAPDYFYYPTVRQVRQIAFAEMDKTKINIVIGGSSVMYGVGQPPGRTMADDLRRDLGAQFTVTNFAMRGGDVSGMAVTMAEMMTREGYRVIYYSDWQPGASPTPTGEAPYRYFYFDARARGYVMASPARDAAIAAQMGRYWQLSNLELGAWLNSMLDFNDLWQTIGYTTLFTKFSTLEPDHFWRPRREYPDPEIDLPHELRYGNTAANLEVAKGYSRIRLPEDAGQEIKVAFDAAIPAAMRTNTVIGICANSPFVLGMMTQAEQDRTAYARHRWLNWLSDYGAAPVDGCEGFDKDDYVDRVHLTPEGAQKLAPRIAEAVRTLSRKIGWLPPAG
jgi:hypothetical protein